MAGLTSTFTFKPLLNKPHKPISLNSLNSKLFGLRFTSPTTISIPTSLVCSTFISARYGGSGGGGKGSFRRSRPDCYHALESYTCVGIVSKIEAVQMVEDAGLNLVILSPNAEPPVLRIMDYDKYRYEQQKRKKEQQKKSAAGRMDLKELEMGYNIDVHDYSARLKAAKKFLKDGDKVKVIVNLKGRENEFRNNTIELIRRFQNDIGELATEENKSFRDRNIFVVLVPNKAVVQKDQEQPKKTESSTTSV